MKENDMVYEYHREDVIAAIATGAGEGGIGIVRLSGSDVLDVLSRVYVGSQKPDTFESHTIHYGHIVRPDNQSIIDEVLVSYMRAPRSYTAENTVEINCHGGMVALNAVLDAVIAAGARLAKPGEFTMRAVENGRIDLSQAEAVLNIINAKTEKSLRYAEKQLAGGLSKKYIAIDDELMHMLMMIDASIDYPEYDIEEMTEKEIISALDQCIALIDDLLSTARTGKIMQEGMNTLILGEPNVGKSSLFNALITEDRALVTDIPGTTRDFVDTYLNLEGIPFRLIDTAGIRETADIVERLGVDKAIGLIDEAELIIDMRDVSRETHINTMIEKQLNQKKRIIVYNKIDLCSDDHHPDCDVAVSAKTGEGIDKLKTKMVEIAQTSCQMRDDSGVVLNKHHAEALTEIRSHLIEAKNTLTDELPIDMAAIDLNEALIKLRAITGKSVGDDIIDSIFANFCLGK